MSVQSDATQALDLLLTGGQLVTCEQRGEDALGVIADGAVAIRDGRIVALGEARALAQLPARETVHVGGRVIMPGLVDPHTHLVFASDRASEFAMKMAGVPYLEIAAKGGGIMSSVRALREASDDVLFEQTKERALAMRRLGVTTIEVKSGYGLSLKHELRALEVAKRLQEEGIASTEATLLGAHVVPAEFKARRDEYVALVSERMIPEAVERGLASSCDVYLDEGAFTRDEAEQILLSAKRHGLHVRAHVGQFSDQGGAELLAELGGLSGDHLEEVSDAGLEAMANADVVGVLLPGAWRTLRQQAPDGARFRSAGVKVAIGTDCNPGTSPCVDLPLCAALAVRDAYLTSSEAILGITRHAADALGRSDIGRLAPGARADIAVMPYQDALALTYGLGGQPASRVYMGGRLVEENESASLFG